MKPWNALLQNLKARLEEVSSIDSDAAVAKHCWISGSSIRGKVSIASRCKIYKSYIQGAVEIGRYTSLWGPGLHVMSQVNSIVIGPFCSIARGVSIQEYNHRVDRASSYFVEKNLFDARDVSNDVCSRGQISIGHDVWIGANAHVLSGVSIGSGAVIGAGAIVTRDVPPYAIVVGNPARIIRMRFDDRMVDELEASRWWEWSEQELLANRDFLQIHRSGPA